MEEGGLVQGEQGFLSTVVEENLLQVGELYEYDSVYRLINFERGELNAQGDTIITPSTEVSQGQEWNLDGVGNWDESTIIDENGNPLVDDRDHSSFNELTTQNGATLLYDDNGNLVEDADYTYQYDSRNRLRIATRKADGEVAVYSYDAMGRRISKEVSNSGANDGVTDFYYDGQQVVEERDGNDDLTQQYVYGNYIDEVLVMDRNMDGDDSAIGGADQRFHYHQDALFSVYAVTDENGDILESYLYDPYGEVTVFDENGVQVADNAWGTANSLIDNPYLFTGRRFDEETGLYYYRARYFDADQGRFISRDPLGYVDGMSLYGGYFVPNGVDPYGMTIVEDWTSITVKRHSSVGRYINEHFVVPIEDKLWKKGELKVSKKLKYDNSCGDSNKQQEEGERWELQWPVRRGWNVEKRKCKNEMVNITPDTWTKLETQTIDKETAATDKVFLGKKRLSISQGFQIKIEYKYNSPVKVKLCCCRLKDGTKEMRIDKIDPYKQMVDTRTSFKGQYLVRRRRDPEAITNTLLEALKAAASAIIAGL